jgi:hypothetical protein
VPFFSPLAGGIAATLPRKFSSYILIELLSNSDVRQEMLSFGLLSLLIKILESLKRFQRQQSYVLKILIAQFCSDSYLSDSDWESFFQSMSTALFSRSDDFKANPFFMRFMATCEGDRHLSLFLQTKMELFPAIFDHYSLLVSCTRLDLQ